MRWILTLLLFVVSFSGFAQNERIDNLTVQLAFQDQDSTKVDLSIELINELYDI